jgi:hypothetical protein
MLAVAPKGGKCRVMVSKLKTTAMVASDCWLLKVGVKRVKYVVNKINYLLSITDADIVNPILTARKYSEIGHACLHELVRSLYGKERTVAPKS